ncbi:MAG: glutamine--fructose-6-phosphate transaminase (isomerizing) [Deltaproteobacteria bacterium]|nr:glutamine--fructose-6-phosphate transaminase (isomerizing) [Deltaproteobacteria bacterium]
MCGIVGYIGVRDAAPVLIDSLRKLEYRGYDSAGIAVLDGGEIALRRSEGKLARLEALLAEVPVQGHAGIGHTRWATHGGPSEANAHPHRAGDTVVVHNGIIENYLDLKEALLGNGAELTSDTDTELVAHLAEAKLAQGKDLLDAVRETIREIHGSYALVFLSQREPGRLIVAKNASPIVIGAGDGETFIASDIPALLEYTRDVAFLEDGEIAEVRADGFRILDATARPLTRATRRITWDAVAAQKGGYRHFMLKEIHEQPQAVTDTLRGRIALESGAINVADLNLTEERLAHTRKIHLVGCGTAWHAALVGKFLIEELARIPAEVDYGSEFRHRTPLLGADSLLLLVSQSGETADTLASLDVGRRQGAGTVSVCNVVDSSLARKSDGVFYTHAGPEISVASTKAFTTQLTALYLLAVELGRLNGQLPPDAATRLLEDATRLPGWIEAALRLEEPVAELAHGLSHADDVLYLGRGINYPIALEGALKLKEISYIHAEGYPAGEMKHGPIALIDESMPVVMILPRDHYYPKTLSNLKEVEARGGNVVIVTDEPDGSMASTSTLVVPKVPYHLAPVVLAIPLQLLAYHIAVHRGTDVDQPRNLAKSVTVE